MSKVYVVISESIIQGHSSHGLHGVYTTKESAKITAISAIKGIAKHDVEVINEDDLEFSYINDNIEIYVSCIEQEVR